LVFVDRRVQKGEAIAVIIDIIGLVTKSFHRRGPGSKKVALVAKKEARYPPVRRLPSNQRRDKIRKHPPSRHNVPLSESCDVLYNLNFIALVE
jgi:hypothetical protein